ncbi:MAG TPA: hypothetical protein VF614_14480 [Chthoniobacteraceae bacterium]|jgi:hypothetical protein
MCAVVAKSSALCLLLAVALLCAGCETAQVAPPGSRYVVNTTRAAFFKYGPAQSFGPDFNLIQGQRVTMLERSFGYSRVTTDEGVTGYIATDQIQLAPPEPFEARPVTSAKLPPLFSSREKKTGRNSQGSPGRSTSSGKPKRSSVQPTPSDPLFDVSDVPAPLPQEPAAPAPGFRF